MTLIDIHIGRYFRSSSVVTWEVYIASFIVEYGSHHEFSLGSYKKEISCLCSTGSTARHGGYAHFIYFTVSVSMSVVFTIDTIIPINFAVTYFLIYNHASQLIQIYSQIRRLSKRVLANASSSITGICHFSGLSFFL